VFLFLYICILCWCRFNRQRLELKRFSNQGRIVYILFVVSVFITFYVDKIANNFYVFFCVFMDTCFLVFVISIF
jgi:hypothetical protein